MWYVMYSTKGLNLYLRLIAPTNVTKTDQKKLTV